MARSHGLSYHPLFGGWGQMMRRCYNSEHKQFHDYGGRGLTVCAEWHDPAAFIEYVEVVLGPRPTETHTIDRVDNERGYEPGNLRWATRSEQNSNQRTRVQAGYPVGVSGFRGVRIHKPSGLWNARFQSRSLGYFKAPEEAAAAYNVKAFTVLGDRARLNAL